MVHQAVKCCGVNGASCDLPYPNRFPLKVIACRIVTSFTAGLRAVAQDVQK
jgi:hypothetical protein